MTRDVLLFTYGTLRHGGPAEAMVGGRYIGRAWTAPKYQLVEMSDRVGLGKGKKSVKGDVYLVSAAALRRLDDYEDSMYRRRSVDLEDGRKAQAYLLTGRRQKRDYEPNPAWVDELLTKHWDDLESMIGPDRMPIERAGVMKEYGCGAFGCVLPTYEKGTVLKVTTDASEAAFAAAAMRLAGKDRAFPDGIVAYYASFGLREQYRRDPVYLLWRQEAEHVGELLYTARADEYLKLYGSPGVHGFLTDLEGFQLTALDVFDQVGEVKDKEDRVSLLADVQTVLESGTRRISDEAARTIASRVDDLEEIAVQMQSRPFGREVGEALQYYLGHGIVLADVHYGNVGEVGSTAKTVRLAITDPGGMVAVDPAWLAVDIEMVA